MPTYKVTAPDGRVLSLTGDSPPTEEELSEVFGSVKVRAAAEENIRSVMEGALARSEPSGPIAFTTGVGKQLAAMPLSLTRVLPPILAWRAYKKATTGVDPMSKLVGKAEEKLAPVGRTERAGATTALAAQIAAPVVAAGVAAGPLAALRAAIATGGALGGGHLGARGGEAVGGELGRDIGGAVGMAGGGHVAGAIPVPKVPTFAARPWARPLERTRVAAPVAAAESTAAVAPAGLRGAVTDVVGGQVGGMLGRATGIPGAGVVGKVLGTKGARAITSLFEQAAKAATERDVLVRQVREAMPGLSEEQAGKIVDQNMKGATTEAPSAMGRPAQVTAVPKLARPPTEGISPGFRGLVESAFERNGVEGALRQAKNLGLSMEQGQAIVDQMAAKAPKKPQSVSQETRTSGTGVVPAQVEAPTMPRTLSVSEPQAPKAPTATEPSEAVAPKAQAAASRIEELFKAVAARVEAGQTNKPNIIDIARTEVGPKGKLRMPERPGATTVERQDILSRGFRSYGYDEASGIMEVEFPDGAIYRYHGVSPADAAAVATAPSRGAALLDITRKYPGTRQGTTKFGAARPSQASAVAGRQELPKVATATESVAPTVPAVGPPKIGDVVGGRKVVDMEPGGRPIFAKVKVAPVPPQGRPVSEAMAKPTVATEVAAAPEADLISQLQESIRIAKAKKAGAGPIGPAAAEAAAPKPSTQRPLKTSPRAEAAAMAPSPVEELSGQMEGAMVDREVAVAVDRLRMLSKQAGGARMIASEIMSLPKALREPVRKLLFQTTRMPSTPGPRIASPKGKGPKDVR